MTKGCAVASVLGMLEERETAARVRVESLREEAARLAEVLVAAEIELDRLVIAREELVEAGGSNSRSPHLPVVDSEVRSGGGQTQFRAAFVSEPRPQVIRS
jgi:hypothetical protein